MDAGDGRPTVVNLWASWCAACVREMPLLQRRADRAGGGVRSVGIDTEDERDSAAGLLAATGVRYEQYDDPDGEVRDAARAVGLPVTLVYDASGREVARRFGEVEAGWLDDALRTAGVRCRRATEVALPDVVVDGPLLLAARLAVAAGPVSFLLPSGRARPGAGRRSRYDC